MAASAVALASAPSETSATQQGASEAPAAHADVRPILQDLDVIHAIRMAHPGQAELITDTCQHLPHRSESGWGAVNGVAPPGSAVGPGELPMGEGPAELPLQTHTSRDTLQGHSLVGTLWRGPAARATGDVAPTTGSAPYQTRRPRTRLRLLSRNILLRTDTPPSKQSTQRRSIIFHAETGHLHLRGRGSGRGRTQRVRRAVHRWFSGDRIGISHRTAAACSVARPRTLVYNRHIFS